ncbi:MAG: MFS transporter [Candidatus Pacebacteria bacterium]|nr:MFS transporter [Candidatus Paceibacterota bacterium]
MNNQTDSSRQPPPALSARDRERGQKRFRLFMMMNTIPVACLLENVIILYAIRNRLSDPLVAIMASFLHLTMPFIVLGKRLVARLGLARTWGLCWAVRYMFAASVIFAPFFSESFVPWLVPFILMAGYLGLMVFRSIGTVATQPLVGEITTDRDRGRFISHYAMLTAIIYLVAMVGIIWALRRWDRMGTYHLIIAIGCVVGFVSAYVLTTIPESAGPRQSARQPIRKSLRKVFKHKPYANLLVAWCAGFISFAVIIPFAIMAVKNGYGTSDYEALTYSALILVGSIIAAFVNGVIADHVGPRPLVILYFAGFFAVCLIWAFAPATLIPLLVGTSFFVAGFCKQGLIVGLGHYFLSLVSQDDRVGVGLFTRMFSGAAAGLAGAVVGAGLLRVLPLMALSDLDVYRLYFRIIAVLLIPLLMSLWKLPRLKEWSIRNVLGLFLSPRDLRAMIALNRVRGTENYSDDLNHVQRLSDIASNVSESAVLEYLQSAHLSIRSRALRALARQDYLSPQARDALRAELWNGEFTTAWIAAETLGEKRIKEAVPDLRAALDSDDFFLKGKAMQALVQLKDQASFDRIVAEFEATDNPRLVIYGAHAMGLMGNPAHIPVLLKKAVTAALPAPVCDEVLSAAAGLVGQGETMYRLLKQWRTDREGLLSLLMEMVPRLGRIEHWDTILQADSEAQQLEAFNAFCESNRRSDITLCRTDIASFALQARRNGVLEKIFLCCCLLLLSKPASPASDDFLQIL